MSIIRDGIILNGIIPGGNFQDVVYIFSGSSETFTVPSGVDEVIFEAWGGGGKGFGDSAPAATQESYPAGGGGAYALTTVSVVAGQQYLLTVGAGSTSQGVNGSNTTITSGATTYCLADGGSSPTSQGSGGDGGEAKSSIGDVKYDGGRGGAGCTSNCGNPGGDGGGAAGSTGAAAGSIGTSEFGGDGGDGGATAHIGDVFNDGLPGNVYGAGGGGGSSYNSNSCSGGNGAQGLIRVTYTAPL